MLSYILNCGLTNGKGSSQDAGSLHAEKREKTKGLVVSRSFVTSSVVEVFWGQQRRGGLGQAGGKGGLHSLGGAQYSHAADVRVFTIHVIGEDDDLENVCVYRFAKHKNDEQRMFCVACARVCAVGARE
jgi:hypothetical protein